MISIIDLEYFEKKKYIRRARKADLEKVRRMPRMGRSMKLEVGSMNNTRRR
jgi:hypothetical protein